jgi:hypothetical protein
MGLEISKGFPRQVFDAEDGTISTIDAKVIHIKGTDIELASVYGRVSLICLQDGFTISVSIKTYMDYYAYKNASELITDINQLSFDFVISETETQSIEVGLEYAKNRFIELGYFCEIN